MVLSTQVYKWVPCCVLGQDATLTVALDLYLGVQMGTGKFNPLHPNKSDLWILLYLMPDDFTCQRETR